MLVTFILGAFSLLQVSANADVQLKMRLQNVAVEEVFEEIKKQSEFDFFYNADLLKGLPKLDLKVKNVGVTEILEEIIPDHLMYEIVDNTIIIKKNPNYRPEILNNQLDLSVSGRVTDEEGLAIPGVNVIIKGTTMGTITDIEGRYVLAAVPDDAILVFSFIGYVDQEIEVQNRSTIDVALSVDTKQLEEIVVIGYGSVQKRDLTGSVSQVNSEDINAYPTPSVDQALRGRATGVRVTQNSGKPGSPVQIQIRGGNSFLGSNQPLFVVDGFPITGGIDFLNPADIASIDILKDASATAIYGSRGANGVVIISTNRDAKRAGRISLDSYYGVQKVSKTFDFLNTQQYAEIANERARNDGEAEFFDLNNLPDIETDWQDVVFETAAIQSHTLSFFGSTEKSSYNLSGNFFKQDGVLVNSGLKRGSLRFGLDHQVLERVKVTTHLIATRSEVNGVNPDNGSGGGSILSSAYSAPPLSPVYDEDGELFPLAGQFPFTTVSQQHPLAYAAIKNQRLATTIVGDLGVGITIVDGLVLDVKVGTEQTYEDVNFYSPSIIQQSPSGSASVSLIRNISFLSENILTYSRDIGTNDRLTVVGGYTWQNFSGKFNQQSGTGFPNDVLESDGLGSAQIINPNISNVSEWTLLSWLGRANYSLNDKMLFTFSVRADGSSRFGADNKWAVFPSGAFAWRLSDEEFIRNLNLFSNLKLRASYGQTGSTALRPYQSLNRLSSVRTIFGNSDFIGIAPSALPNPELQWETTTQLDIGLDFGFMDERIRLTLDYYDKKTEDLLANIPIAPSTGFGTVTTNLGEISNKGFELGIGADIFVGDFTWDVFAQMSFNNSEVVKIGEDVFGSGLGIPLAAPLNLAREGEPLGVFFGFTEDGLTDDGFVKYVDLDGDGEITNDDRSIIGNPYPDFIFSWNNNFSFKNFELNVFFEGVSGNDVFFATSGTHANSFARGTNQFVDVYNSRFTAENLDTDAKYPLISTRSVFRVSDRYVKDGSYLRFRNIRLAYNLPVSNLDINWLQSLQVYVSGQNLITITDYPGLSPEVNSRGATGDLRIGIDEASHPDVKIYTFGIKVGF